MGIPVALLLGFVAMFLGHGVSAPVPGSSSMAGLLLSAPLWVLPTAMAAFAKRRLRRRLQHARAYRILPRRWLQFSALLSPLCVHAVAVHGGWLDRVAEWAGNSHLLTMLLLALPLAVIELPRLLLATWFQICEDGDPGEPVALPAAALPGLAAVWPALRLRLGWPLMMPLPMILLGGGLDLLQLDREAYCLCVGTAVGTTLGMLALFVGFAVVLPWWFRVAFGTSVALPEPTATRLRGTARALGFRPERLHQLGTGDRALNAMMVGPLPFGRILVLTDGLLRTLDDDLLVGVVAHEVGHARAGHPALLLALAAGLPLLLLSPLAALQIESLDVTTQALVTVLAVGLLWTLVRGLAHRFEHEADVASVQALGAGPCSHALLAVARIAVPVSHGWFGRIFTLHPEEMARCTVMQRFEIEPGFRDRFLAGSRRVRLAIAGLLCVAGGWAATIWWADWPFERALWRLDCGDIRGASTAFAAVGDEVPERWRKIWKVAQDELAAAVELGPEVADWATAQAVFPAAAEARGLEIWRARGPAAARPWLALAVVTDRDSPLLRKQLFEFARAAAEGDVDRMHEVRAVLHRQQLPSTIASLVQ